MTESSPFKPGVTPEVFVQDIQPKTSQVQLVRLTEDQYRTASFLDQRILGPDTPSHVAEWAVVAAAAQSLPPKSGPDYVFHIGHTGSTLLSRVLGDHPAIFSLREPPWLRTLATDINHFPRPSLGETAIVLGKLAGRTFQPEQRALVKATSFTSEIASLLLPASPNVRVIGMVASPQGHMATLIAGENNITEVEALGPSRLSRLASRAPNARYSWSQLGLGERLAATWLAEMASLSQALAFAGGSALAVDFDAFLSDPAAVLNGILFHLHGRADADMVASLARSPHFSRYSKAQSHDFSPQHRQETVARAWRDHADVLKAGMAWLGVQLRSHPELARLLGPFLSG